MVGLSQVFVDLQFLGRLKKSHEFWQAEIWLLKEYMIDYGTSALDVPGYSVLLPAGLTSSGKSVYPFWLKVRGEWSPLWLLMVTNNIASFAIASHD